MNIDDLVTLEGLNDESKDELKITGNRFYVKGKHENVGFSLEKNWLVLASIKRSPEFRPYLKWVREIDDYNYRIL